MHPERVGQSLAGGDERTAAPVQPLLTLQGANLLGGSFMTGSRLWLVIGLVALVAGAALLLRAVRGRR